MPSTTGLGFTSRAGAGALAEPKPLPPELFTGGATLGGGVTAVWLADALSVFAILSVFVVLSIPILSVPDSASTTNGVAELIFGVDALAVDFAAASDAASARSVSINSAPLPTAADIAAADFGRAVGL